MPMKWTFSPSSELYLRRCIAAAPQPDLDNKWYQKLGVKDSPVLDKNIEKPANVGNNSHEVGKEAPLINYEDFFDTIESESTVPLEYVMKECNKNPELVTKMAEKLSINKVEQLFKHIFHKKDIENNFLKTFSIHFLPTYFREHTSRLCIDLLVKLNEEYPEIFQELLEILMNDTQLPNQVLKNYIAALNETSVTSFMQNLSSIELTLEGFSHNVLVIYLAYKDCIKNDQIQNYIQKMIVQYSKGSVTDRNFGRLFLTYLQSEKALERNVSIQILECLEAHRSPFKRPCSMLLKEI